tara:strand:+ start:660 stop:821 length:162 start_codon:yes stop_codon:yes gene_type:complete
MDIFIPYQRRPKKKHLKRHHVFQGEKKPPKSQKSQKKSTKKNKKKYKKYHSVI